MADKIDLLRKKRALLKLNQELSQFVNSDSFQQLLQPRLDSMLNQFQSVLNDIQAPAETVKAAQVGKIALINVVQQFAADSEIARLTKEIEKLEEEVDKL